MKAAADRGDAHPAQPARRAGPAARRHLRRRPLDRRRPASARDPGGAVPRALARAARRRPRHAVGPLPVRRVRRPQAARRLGPPDRRGRQPQRRAGRRRSRAAARSRTAGCSASSCPATTSARGGRRVGELDEEMVYESRVGETFLLGASTWRIEEIRPDRVIVTPAPGEPGKMPFWHGDAVGRPIELGRAIGAFLRELEPMKPAEARGPAARGRTPSTSCAARNLVAYLGEQREVTGALPTDRTIVVERFRDELGDWRVVLLTPFGGRVHAPWSMAIEARLRERHGLEVQAIWSDDGIAVRLPEGAESDGSTIEGALLLEPGRDRGRAHGRSSAARRSSPLASARTPRARCCCRADGRGSARRCGCSASARPTCWRSPATTARSRSSSRPTARSCATSSTCRPCASCSPTSARGASGWSASRSRSASPFASSLLFDYIGSFMYEGDAPLAERRAQALALDRELLAELLGSRGAARADRPGGGGRPRARAPGAGPDRGRLERSTASPTCCAGWATCARTRSSRASSGLDAAAALDELETDPARGPRADRRRGALDRGRGRRRATATRSAPARRRALPRRYLDAGRRAARRCCWRAGRARTPRSPPMSPPRAGGSPAATVEERLRALAATGDAAGGRLPTRRRGPRVHRSRRAAPAAPPLAGAPAPRGRAGRAGRSSPASCPRGTASDRTAGGLGRLVEVVAQLEGCRDPGIGPRARRAAGSRRRLHAPPARRAGRGRRGRVDRARVARPRRRPGRALSGATASTCSAPAGTAEEPPVGPGPRRDPRSTSSGAARRSSRSCAPRWRGGAQRRGAARRDLGPRLGRRGHERHVRRRCGRCRCRASRSKAGASTRDGSLALGPPRAAGPLVAGGRPGRRGALAHRARAMPWRRRCSSATAS